MVRRHGADGRVLEEERRAPQAQILAYTYDLAGRLARVDVRSRGGPDCVQELYLFKDDQTSVFTLYVNPPLRDMKNVADSADRMLHMSIDAVRIITARDSKGRPTEKFLYDVDNRVIRQVLFRYQGAGRLLAEGEAESGERPRADMRNTYRCDARGRCIEALMRWGAFGGRRETKSYNEMGDLEEERVAPLRAEALFMKKLHGRPITTMSTMPKVTGLHAPNSYGVWTAAR
jgi:YD repeat-containing protein